MKIRESGPSIMLFLGSQAQVAYWLRSTHLLSERRLAHWAYSCQQELEAGKRGGGPGPHQASYCGGAPVILPVKLLQIVIVSI